MTLDGLLTFFTLVVAVLALMPVERRWMITLRGPLVWLITAAAMVLAIYLELFSALGQPCPALFGYACKALELAKAGEEQAGRLSAPQAAFIVVGLWLAVAGWIAWRQKVGVGALPGLAATVVEKLAEGRHESVVQLVAPNITLMDRVAGRKLLLTQLDERLRRLDPYQSDVAMERSRADRSAPRAAWLLRLASRLRGLVPSTRRGEAAAHEALRAVFTTPQIATFLAQARPRIGVQLLDVRASRFVFDFSAALFRRMLQDPLSHLYRELPLNQNVSSTEGYWLPPHNPYLHFLFADARNAERLGVCDDLADAALNRLRDDDYIAALNRTARGFSDEGKWLDPVFATLRMFDIQARAFAIQGVAWHASIYQMPHLLRALLAGYRTGEPGVDANDEWPIRRDYLIYTMFSALTDWAELSQHLPSDAPHRRLDDESIAHQNDSVPKSAMLVIGMCLRDLLDADAMPERQKDYIFEIVLRSVADYPATPDDLARFRRAYAQCIVQAGGLVGAGRSAHRDAIEVLFHAQDPELQRRAKVLADLL